MRVRPSASRVVGGEDATTTGSSEDATDSGSGFGDARNGTMNKIETITPNSKPTAPVAIPATAKPMVSPSAAASRRSRSLTIPQAVGIWAERETPEPIRTA